MHIFPEYTSSFIGRDTDAAMIMQYLRSERLLSLVGPSGTGKTRLSLQVVPLVQDLFPDGMTFVDVSALTDPELVLPTIGISLGIRDTDDQPILEKICQALNTRQHLILLDNVEHVRDAAQYFADLLANTTHVTLMITSQVPLGLPTEKVLRIPPLGFPEANVRVSPQELLTYPAIALFMDRLRLVQPNVELTASNAGVVRQICAMLQGIPLAIELVAANSRQLPMRDVLLLLKNYLPPLPQGSVLSRKELITPVLNWCYSIFSEDMKQLYPRLSIFDREWTIEFATAILDPTNKDGSLEHTLKKLVDHHIVLEEYRSDGTYRYRMVDAIWANARHLLNQQEQYAFLQQRHAAVFGEFVTQVDRVARTPEETAWFDRLEQEISNVRAALRWAVSSPATYELAARMCAELSRFWQIRGYVKEGYSWIQHVLKYGLPDSLQLKAYLLYGQGLLNHMLSRYDQARAAYQESLATYTIINDEECIARVANNLALIEGEQGHDTLAQTLLGQALDIRRKQGNRWAEALILNNLGSLLNKQGDFQGAYTYYIQSLAIRRELNDLLGIATAVGNLGSTVLCQGDITTARDLLEEGVQWWCKVGDKLSMANTSADLGRAYIYLNRLDQARLILDWSLLNRWQQGSLYRLAGGLEAHTELLLAEQSEQLAAETLVLATSIREKVAIPRSAVEQAQFLQLQATLDQAGMNINAHMIYDVRDETINTFIERLITTPEAVMNTWFETQHEASLKRS